MENRNHQHDQQKQQPADIDRDLQQGTNRQDDIPEFDSTGRDRSSVADDRGPGRESEEMELEDPMSDQLDDDREESDESGISNR